MYASANRVRARIQCTNFTCCGMTLPDMHALLDHFEESHVVVVGADGRPVYPAPPSPAGRPRTPSASDQGSSPATSPYSRFHPHLAQHSSQAPVASIVIDYPKPFPPATPSAYDAPMAEYGLGLDTLDAFAKSPYPDLADPYDPFGFSTAPPPPPMALDTDSDMPFGPLSPMSASSASSPAPSDALSAFDASARSSPATSVCSASPSPRAAESACLPPAMLSLPAEQQLPPSIARARPAHYTTSALNGPAPQPTPSTFRPYYPHPTSSTSASPSPAPTTHAHTAASKTKQQLLHGSASPAPAPKISGRRRDRDRERAYACPNPNCSKRYLNPNGLKYHMEKGTCTAAGPRPWETPLPHAAAPGVVDLVKAACGP